MSYPFRSPFPSVKEIMELRRAELDRVMNRIYRAGQEKPEPKAS